MVYSRKQAASDAANTDSEPSSPHNQRHKRKKRKKLAVTNLKPNASGKKVLAAWQKDQERRSGEFDNEAAAEPPTPTPRTREEFDVPETFVFTTKKAYQRARALFPFGYSASLSANARAEDSDVPVTLRWYDLMSLLTSPPISCEVAPSKGVAQKISRPARNGVQAASVVLHKPHGNNPRCEREVMENIGGQLLRAFSWTRGGFVLGSTAMGEDDTAESTEDDRSSFEDMVEIEVEAQVGI